MLRGPWSLTHTLLPLFFQALGSRPGAPGAGSSLEGGKHVELELDDHARSTAACASPERRLEAAVIATVGDPLVRAALVLAAQRADNRSDEDADEEATDRHADAEPEDLLVLELEAGDANAGFEIQANSVRA